MSQTDTKGTVDRPTFLKDHHLLFLDELRDSGATNMFGAAPYVMDAYHLSREKAVAIVSYWMKTFGERHPVRGR